MTASISISMRHAGLSSAATTTMVAAGRICRRTRRGRGHGFPVFDMGEVHAGADDVVKGGAGFGEGFLDDLEDAAGLPAASSSSAPTGPVPET